MYAVEITLPYATRSNFSYLSYFSGIWASLSPFPFFAWLLSLSLLQVSMKSSNLTCMPDVPACSCSFSSFPECAKVSSAMFLSRSRARLCNVIYLATNHSTSARFCLNFLKTKRQCERWHKNVLSYTISFFISSSVYSSIKALGGRFEVLEIYVEDFF